MTLIVETAATLVLAEQIKSIFTGICEHATQVIKDSWAKTFADFAPYMEEMNRKCSSVRILCCKNADIPLYDIYVSGDFRQNSCTIRDDELILRIREGGNVIVNGIGGAGKTLFMKHLFISLFATQYQYAPIFIELRKFNDSSKVSFMEFLRCSISDRNLEQDVFEYFLQMGRFCFLLDGFDEVARAKRDAVQTEILEIANKYPLCRFVVSSRYDMRFAGWSSFDVYDTQPFDMAKTRILLTKVPFDGETKNIFLEKIDTSFFNANKEFLSSPLLAIMMMMTFKDNMDVPKKMSIFYEQAFNTLYQWHDATKAFSREKFLEIDEFRRSFEWFCLFSYFDERYEFSKSDLIKYVKKSNDICGINLKASEVLSDYEESVNLVRQEGLKYIFIHRSFQEYFSASALIKLGDVRFARAIAQISQRHSDNVVKLCFEINGSLVLHEYLKRIYTELLDENRFPAASDNGLSLFESQSAYYQFFCTKNANSISVGGIADVDKKLLEYMCNVRKFRGMRPTPEGMALPFPRRLYDILETALRPITFDIEINVKFRVHSGKIIWECFSEESAKGMASAKHRKVIGAAEKKIAKSAEKIEKEIRELAEVFCEEVRDHRRWSERELSLLENRDLSLDDLLGIANQN